MRSVLILFGGASPEHEVSRRSAAAVIENINRENNQIHTVGITKAGCWYYTRADAEEIRSGAWERRRGNIPAMLDYTSEKNGLLLFTNPIQRVEIDVAFPVLHGENCEDGKMQGLLELTRIPFVGPGLRASANAMDKATTKVILQAAGIAQADYIVFRQYNFDGESAVSQVESKFVYPVFVKPSANGSSCGVSKVKRRDELIDAIGAAFQFDDKVLVEEFVDGRELEVAVLGNEDAFASVCGEIVSGSEFYDYNAKYVNSDSRLYIPAPLDPEKAEEIRGVALKAYRALECGGLSRVDFFLQENGRVVLNEINTLPGFTDISMYPKLMMHSKEIDYGELIELLLDSAV